MELLVAFVSFFAVTGAWLVLPAAPKDVAVHARLDGIPTAA